MWGCAGRQIASRVMFNSGHTYINYWSTYSGTRVPLKLHAVRCPLDDRTHRHYNSAALPNGRESVLLPDNLNNSRRSLHGFVLHNDTDSE